MAIKTHKFKGKTFAIDFDNFKNIYGLTCQSDTLVIQSGVELKAIDSLLHEALHAMGIPDSYLHKDDGSTNTLDLSKFVQRWIKENIEQLIIEYRKGNI